MKKHAFLCLILCLFFSVSVKASSYLLYGLTCEQAYNPIGVDNMTPHFSWKIRCAERGTIQGGYQVIVSNSQEGLLKNEGNVWNSGKVETSQSILIPYKGEKLLSCHTYYWKVRSWNVKGEASPWSECASFTMGILSGTDWNGAKWIEMEKDNPINRYATGIERVSNVPDYNKKIPYKMPQFRKEFGLNKSIKRAIVYVSGLGQFELFLNGQKVGNHFFDPGWTNYDSLALYVSFDVTKLLNKGRNVIGMMLGGGFYSMTPNDPKERYIKFYTSYGAPKMRLNLHVEYEDGSVTNVVSDRTWKTVQSPVTYASVYGGEDYDATLYRKGWMMSDFKDKKWNDVVISDYNPIMSSQQYDAITINQELPAVRIFKNKEGWVYDFGQNASGIFRIKVVGKRGSSVTITPCELLKSDSTITQWSCGGKTYFKYTLAGEGEEAWNPQFAYYGFRYLLVKGAVPMGKQNEDSLPKITGLVSLHTCNSAQEVGSFSCSKPLYNKIHELIDWAIRSNMASLLTDCPHREKLGWLEESHLMQYSIQYRYNMSLLLKKIMRDMQLAQTKEGIIPSICPEYSRFKAGFENSPEWGSTFIISPYYYYLWYGDKSLVEKYYPYMQKYVDYLSTRADNYIVSYGLGDWYDIGPKRPGYSQLTSYGVTATSSYYYDVKIMQQVAGLLGRNVDAEKYGMLLNNIRKAFNDKYFHADSCYYDRNSQAANALPIFLGIVEPRYKQRVLDNLVNDIRKRGNANSAGDIGYRYVLRALAENGRQDVIYDMNNRYDVPGYGYQLAHGATSLTEAWDGLWRASQNHLMLGHIMEWFYGELGGIKADENTIGFKRVIINPQITGDVTHANTSYESPYGHIQCDWKLKNDEYVLHINIPANSSAIVYLPTKEVDNVTDYGQPLDKSEGLKIMDGNENVKLSVGSGEYCFKMKYSN